MYLQEVLSMNGMIRIRAYDVAIFLKENAEEILETRHDFSKLGILDLVCTWNKSVKEISDCGYFFDKESNRYKKPSTTVAIKAVKLMFEANESENIFYIDRKNFGSWINYFINKYALSTSNSIVKRRHGTIERAKDSLLPRCL